MRRAGILMPISSLPSPYGIGCFSAEAYRFVDFLREAGQSLWQLLPMGMTGYGDSPYQSFSAFGGNPYFIDPSTLVAEGLLRPRDCEKSGLCVPFGRVDYTLQHRRRLPLLRLAYERSAGWRREERERFDRENQWWLEDFVLFMAARSHFGEAPLCQWQEPYRRREPWAVAELRERCGDTASFHRFLQFCFWEQWGRLRSYAAERGIQTVGDLPIYLSADSAEVWAHPELFLLDGAGMPISVAGCPPDGFSKEGQRWGNPLYRWETHAADGYAFWRRRFAHGLSCFDLLRVDHFRGFDEYYAIPASSPDGREGEWRRGPSMALFSALADLFEGREVIAEDLGYRTDSVRKLVRESGFMSTRLLSFGFQEEDPLFLGEYLPHNYGVRSAAYTGTHDNATLRGWLSSLSREEEARLREYLWEFERPLEALTEPLIALLMRSPSELCIIPMADHLGLSEEGRINRPASLGDNWRWRMGPDDGNAVLAAKIRRLTALGGRRAGEAAAE